MNENNSSPPESSLISSSSSSSLSPDDDNDLMYDDDFSNYDFHILSMFNHIEENVREKNTKRLLSDVSAILLTKIIKFRFSNQNWREERKNQLSGNVYAGIHSLISFAFERLCQLKSEQSYDPSMLTQFSDPKDFSLECSPDVLDKYNNLRETQIIERENLRDYYHVQCQSDLSVEFQCDTSEIVRDEKLKPYLILRDIMVYIHFNHLNHWRILVLELADNKSLLIATWGSNSENKLPFPDIFEFLLNINLHDIVSNSVAFANVEEVMLPWIGTVHSVLDNVEDVFNEVEDLDDVFLDKYGNRNKCTNFKFQSVSKLSFKNIPSNTNTNTNTNTRPRPITSTPTRLFKNIGSSFPFCKATASQNQKNLQWLITGNKIEIKSPFLYLIFDQRDLLLSGGIFDSEG